METMFENLEVKQVERTRAKDPTEVPEAVKNVIEQAWDAQVTEQLTNHAHVVQLTSKDEVDVFHKFARAAARQRSVPLSYRRLSRAGTHKVDTAAYFSIALPEPGEGDTEGESGADTQGEKTSGTAKKTPARRDRAAQ